MPDWSIMFDDDGHILDADEQRKQLLEQRRAELQQKRQEANEKERQSRLEQCLRIIRERGGSVSRKQLTEILVKVFERERSTVASYITGWLKDKAIVEIDSMVLDSNNMVLNL